MEEGAFLFQRALTITEVFAILQNTQETYITTPPQKPKAGQVFLYKADNAEIQGIIYNLQLNTMWE